MTKMDYIKVPEKKQKKKKKTRKTSKHLHQDYPPFHESSSNSVKHGELLHSDMHIFKSERNNTKLAFRFT